MVDVYYICICSKIHFNIKEKLYNILKLADIWLMFKLDFSLNHDLYSILPH
jgi:hypothetical protein